MVVNQTCVLVDLHAPRVEGWELLERLRSFVPSDAFVPFLMLTNESTALERRQALKAGATDLLTKPLDFEELSLRVARLLDTRRLTVTLQREREMLASMVSDQTEERALELIRTNTALERLVRAKDEFIASVSHELRTPLTAVVGFARKLSDDAGSVRSRGVAAITKIIAEQSSDVAAIIDDLLVAARAEIGRVESSRGASRPEGRDPGSIVGIVGRAGCDPVAGRNGGCQGRSASCQADPSQSSRQRGPLWRVWRSVVEIV